MTPGTATLAPQVPREALARARRDARVAALVRAHHGFAWRVLRRFGLSREDADDASQQVFLVLADRLDDVASGKERAFLFRTAMHVAARAHRSRRRRREDAAPDCDDGPGGGPATDEIVERRRARALLDRLLDEMSDELKAVIVLFEIEELTMAEIADALEVPPGTVASRLRRARADLAERLARHHAAERAGGAEP